MIKAGTYGTTLYGDGAYGGEYESPYLGYFIVGEIAQGWAVGQPNINWSTDEPQ